tara:strand:- start:3248 stop:5764 length:2517 start_codon:yes stop_codon:yes gene_type:complete
MADQKTSLLISSQLPEFVREEHPNFIAFLEAYYEFLENAQGTQLNDLVTKSKDLRYITDVDTSIDDFHDNFFATYADLFPQDVQVDRAILLKHVLPLYLAKGSEKSFKLLFRLLYNQELEILQPKTNILRASDGKWLIENAFKISQTVYSVYTGDATTKIFKLAQLVTPDEISVYVDGVIQTSGYNVRRESRKLVFDTAPATDADIEVLYASFDFNLLQNRKLTGTTSGATAIVERTSQKTNNANKTYELYINNKTLLGTFANGENALLDIIDAEDDTIISIKVLGLSNLRNINIIDGGASYNIGDPVVITGGLATTDAEAIVSDVFSGFINKIEALQGGAGFKIGSNVNVVGLASNTALTLAIDAVDLSGQNTANTFTVNTDRIADFASINISDADYNFNASVIPAGENANTKLIDAFSFITLTSLGAITNVAILYSNASFSTVPELNADSAQYLANGSTHFILSSHSLGRIQIANGGDGYQIGDELQFYNKPMSFGIGAAAAVTDVSSNGAITKVEFQPSRIVGTANTFGTTNVTVIGTNTYFEDDLSVGDLIMINNESRYINTISSNTSLNVNVNFNYATTQRNIGVYGKHLIGGQNYSADKLPSITVASTTGANANLSVIALMGDGEDLYGSADQALGAILNIRIINSGAGYQYPPQIDLTGYGDATATANASVESSYVTFPGRWTTSDSILSASERVVQGREYYVDYSYVLSSSVEFTKFKEIFKNLIHPAGFIEYAEYKIVETIPANTITTSTITTSNTISGTVNVYSGSIVVTGTNTRFNIANTNSILTIGSQIAVNSQIRTVNSIYSNGTLTVSAAFTQTANDQTLVIVT